MPLEQEIVTWSESRPAWQRSILHELANGRSLSPDDLTDIASRLVREEAPGGPPLDTSDVPGSDGSVDQVLVKSIKPIEHVNALLDGQELTFATAGMTVIYGDNGSGKSGYARLLKKVAAARHQDEILTDIFEDKSDDVPSAVISAKIAGIVRDEQWPSGDNRALSRISFYDEACGNDYISTASDVTYRPSALGLIDGLIATCDAVRSVLDAQLTANTQAKSDLPSEDENYFVGTFLLSLSDATSQAEIDAACEVPDDVDVVIDGLAAEELRLRQADPVQERSRLATAATNLDALSVHMASLDTKLGSVAGAQFEADKTLATDLRAAAVLASSGSFNDEPVAGVGSDTWRVLWQSARAFAETEVHPGKSFPQTGSGAQCPLCQQDLAPETAERLHRFHTFMTNSTEQQATTAEAALSSSTARIRAVVTLSANIAVALADLEDHYKDTVDKSKASIVVFEQRKASLLGESEDASTPTPDAAESLVTALDELAEAARTQPTTTSGTDFGQHIADATNRRLEIEARRTLHAAKSDLETEVTRLKERTRIELVKRACDTGVITKKSTELARAHVTEIVRDQFTRRSDRLRLERVTLKDIGSQKGQLRHQPSFLGASQNAKVREVLSEGEQTALGLAGFFTEVHFDESLSTVVLDDPVTSLDHYRRTCVAEELAEFAISRPVIVFTHELMFVGELRKGCEALDVPFTERSVERRGDASVGVTSDEHPWKARDAGTRLDHLVSELARIKRERGDWDTQKYESEVADWAGKMSETWERIVSLDIINRVVDRGTLEIRPRLFRLLADITHEDDEEFQQSYGRCSQWARRHDKSPETNYVAPEISALESELSLIRTWHDRVRKYCT